MLRVRDVTWDRWILAGWCAAFAVLQAGRVQDTDPYWQVRAGTEWLTGTPLVSPDTWSWAPVDGLFYPNSPLWNAVLAASWKAFDAWGMFALTVLSIGAYYVTAIVIGRQLGASWASLTVAVVVTSLAALPALSPRAGVPAQTLLLLGIAAAYAWSRRAARHRAVVSAAVVGLGGLMLSCLGNWIHLSWSTMALGLAVAWAVLWLLTPRLGAHRRIALLVAGTVGLVAGIGLGPYGFEAYARAQAVVDACRGLITEWVGVTHPEVIGQWLLPALGAVVLSVTAAVWVVGTLRAPVDHDARAPLVASILVLAGPASLAGFAAVRFAAVALLTLLPVTALAVHAGSRRVHSAAVRRFGQEGRAATYTSERFWRAVLGAVLVVILPFSALYAAPYARPQWEDVTALLPADCRLFSPPLNSAEVLLLRPDVTVWIDGRSDYWGRERIEAFYGFLAGDQDTLVPAGTTCVILPSPEVSPAGARLVAALDASSDWARAAEGGGVILWVPVP